MKKLLALLANVFLFTTLLFSQTLTCDEFAKWHYDEVEGNSYKNSVTPLVVSDDEGYTGFIITMMKYKEDIVLTIYTFGASNCLDKGIDILSPLKG